MVRKSKTFGCFIILATIVAGQTAMAVSQNTVKAVTNSKMPELPNPLDAADRPTKPIIAYTNLPEISFNPPKPVKNPFTIYKLSNIVDRLPMLDALTRLNIQKLSKGNQILSGLKVWKKERTLLRRDFILNNYKSKWFKGYELNQLKVAEIVATIKNANNFALRPARYKLDELTKLINKAKVKIDPNWLKIAGNQKNIELAKLDKILNDLALNNAKIELALSHIALVYTRHASAGQLVPSSVDSNIDVRPKPTATSQILNNIAKLSNKGELQNWLEAQHPQSTEFKTMLAELKMHSLNIKKPEKIVVIPGGKALRAGKKSSRVVKLAKRLEQLGYYSKVATNPYPNVYNKYIVNAVKAYQKSNGLKADGVAGAITIGALNFKKPDYLKTLLVNIERHRWLPRDMGYKHVLVNQAEFRLRVYEGQKITFATNVVIGKNKHQTPVFYNKIRTVVVNPYWNIPNSIIYNEMRKKIIADPSYLSRNNYEAIGNISWEKATKRYVPFAIRQRPGRRNALGIVKFLFPNRHSIYLHDTPSKSLFGRASRAFSHGCVRVQNPRALALNLMGWSEKQFNALIKAGRNRHFALKNKVPVYLTYMTATVNEQGKLRYFRDVYGRDKAIEKALNVKQTLKSIAQNNNKASQPIKSSGKADTKKTKNDL